MRLLIIVIVYLTIVFLVGSPVWAGDQKAAASVMLPNVTVVKGCHCESSAILNALHYLGYEMNEAIVAGGGGAPSFIYQQGNAGNFPFLGGRTGRLREVFFKGAGIQWHLEYPKDPSHPWESIVKILKKGIPVILRVDMQYLPYLFSGQYGPPYMSFGWHMITLFGVDIRKKIAYVSDTGLESLQEIKLEDLEKARFSKSKIFPPHGEYYWVEKRPVDYRLDWKILTLNAINEVVHNMEQVDPPPIPGFKGVVGLSGLKNLGNEIMNIEKNIQNPFLLPMVFGFFHGCIETNGTGGAAFRVLFRDFLKEAGKKVKGIDTSEALTAANAAIEAWHDLAKGFKLVGEKIGTIRDKSKRKEQYCTLAQLANKLYQKEKRLYEKLKVIAR
jgi:hypothetical protein